MKMVAAVGAAAAATIVSGCLISPIIPIGGGKSSNQLQHEGLGKLFPAQLAPLTRWTGEVRAAKVRVWADDEYRAQNVRWQHGFDEQLDYANQVLVPMLGVRLEPEYRSWQHHAPGSPLSDDLEALARTDPGDDVVWVLGLTSSLSLVSGTFDQLGVAKLGERHLVVRGHADVEERKAFERAFPDVGRDERESVLEARRRHKTTAVLIHELAHSLGALHESEPGWIMNPAYSHHAASISDRNREVMLITLEDRLTPPARRDPRATAEKLLAAIDVEWGGWNADDRVQLVVRLRAQLGAAPGAQPAAGIAAAVPAAALDQYHHAERLLASGDHSGALAELEPLLAAYPAHVELRVLVCKIELARGGAKDKKAIAACDRAAGLSAAVEPAIAVAVMRLAAGDAGGARATLAAAEARIASLPPDKAAAPWLTLAGQYREMGAVTWAEAAVARAGAGADIARWAATTRARYGLPRAGARWNLVPEDDAAAVNAVRGVLKLINENKLDAAAKAAGAAERRWPALPGVLAARCDLELRRGALAAARQQCDRAIAQGGSSWALYLSGILELRSNNQAAMAAGIARLRRAIDLDPDLGQAWRALGKALDRAKATAQLDQLRHDYQARFGSLLPN